MPSFWKAGQELLPLLAAEDAENELRRIARAATRHAGEHRPVNQE